MWRTSIIVLLSFALFVAGAPNEERFLVPEHGPVRARSGESLEAIAEKEQKVVEPNGFLQLHSEHKTRFHEAASDFMQRAKRANEVRQQETASKVKNSIEAIFLASSNQAKVSQNNFLANAAAVQHEQNLKAKLQASSLVNQWVAAPKAKASLQANLKTNENKFLAKIASVQHEQNLQAKLQVSNLVSQWIAEPKAKASLQAKVGAPSSFRAAIQSLGQGHQNEESNGLKAKMMTSNVMKSFANPKSQTSLKTEDNEEEESTVGRLVRVLRSNAPAAAFAAVRNHLAAKPSYTVPMKGNNIDIQYGKSTPALISTLVSTLDDVIFVYDKTSCTAKPCRKSAVGTYYDSANNKGPTSLPNKLSYNNGAGNVAGNALTGAEAVIITNLKLTTFGVALTGANDPIPLGADGYIGLGFKPYTQTYNTISTMFASVDDKYITIQKDDDLKNGQLVVGAKTTDKCSSKTSSFFDIKPDSKGVKQWWFTSDTIALGDSSDKSKVIAVDIANDYIYVPADYYQIVYKQTDNHVVKADAKLTSFKITVGSDVLELKPELYTMKGADGKVRSLIRSTPTAEYHVVLGAPFLRQFCVVLQQTDAAKGTYKIGFTVPNDAKQPTKGNNSAGGYSLSLAALLVIPMAQWLRF